jgi:hypothetical protein
MRTLSACILFCAVAFGATLAKAAVIVEAQGPMTVAPVTADTTTGAFALDYTIQSANTDVLVIGAYLDNNNATAETANTNGILYNNQSANGSIASQRAILAYWDSSKLPGVGNTAQFAGTTVTGVAGVVVGYYAWELSNVDLNLGVDQSIITMAGATTGSTVGSITTSSANRLITDFYGANKQNAVTDLTRAVGSVIDTPATGFALLIPGTNTGTVAGGTNSASLAAGVHTLGWTTPSTSSSTRELAFAFAMPVPEPTSLMLLVGGVLMVAGRRRIVG